MKLFLRNFSIAFAAGCFAGLINSLIFWATKHYGLNDQWEIQLEPEFSCNWLYPRIIFGGIFGLLFLLPFMTTFFFWRGVVYSLIPSFVLIFIIIPIVQSLSGLQLNLNSYLYLFVLNAVTSGLAGLWVRAATSKK